MFKKIGSYSQLHPGTNLRVIGVFPFAFDSYNSHTWHNLTNIWNIVK